MVSLNSLVNKSENLILQQPLVGIKKEMSLHLEGIKHLRVVLIRDLRNSSYWVSMPQWYECKLANHNNTANRLAIRLPLSLETLFARFFTERIKCSKNL